MLYDVSVDNIIRHEQTLDLQRKLNLNVRSLTFVWSVKANVKCASQKNNNNTIINMYALYALPDVSSVGENVIASPQRVYVEDILSAPLFVSFTESPHIIQCEKAAVRGRCIVLTTVEMAGCWPIKETRHGLIKLCNAMISLNCTIKYLITFYITQFLQ